MTVLVADRLAGRGAISIPLADMFAPHAAELSPPGPWTFSPGQTVQLRIVPDDGLDELESFVSFIPTAGEKVLLYASRSADLVSFTIPTSLDPQRGQLELTLTESSTNVPCPGAICKRSHAQLWRQ